MRSWLIIFYFLFDGEYISSYIIWTDSCDNLVGYPVYYCRRLVIMEEGKLCPQAVPNPRDGVCWSGL